MPSQAEEWGGASTENRGEGSFSVTWSSQRLRWVEGKSDLRAQAREHSRGCG